MVTSVYTLKDLCSDEYSRIFEYLDYEDYANIYSSNDFLKSMLREQTKYVEIVNGIKNTEVPIDNPRRLFYYFYNKDSLDVARWIYQIAKFDIFILYDVFKHKLCFPSLENIRGLLEICNVNWREYSFLCSEEEYSKKLFLIEKISKEIDNLELDFYLERTEYSIYWENHIEYFNLQCKNEDIGFDQIEIIYCLGINKTLQIYAAFIDCCTLGKFEGAKLLEKDIGPIDDVFRLSLKGSAINDHKEIFIWLCSLEKINKKLFHEVFIDCCERNILFTAMYIYEKFDLKTNYDLLERAIYVCCTSSFKFVGNIEWLKSKIKMDEKKANMYFEVACDANRTDIIGLFHTTGFICPKVVQRCFFNSIISNCLDTTKLLIRFAELEDRRHIMIEALKKACSYGHSGFVEFLLSQYNYSKSILQSCFELCCKFGNYDSARELYEHGNFKIKNVNRLLGILEQSRNFNFYVWLSEI